MSTRYKFKNLGEMEKFFKKHKLPLLTQCEVDHLNGPIIIEEIKFIVKRFPLYLELDGFTGEYYQTLKKEVT